MEVIIRLYSNNKNEISNFLNRLFSKNFVDKTSEKISENILEWQKEYQNPTEIVEIIGTLIENNDKYHINMWISLDPGLFINITENNADKIIRYIYERYP